VGAGTRPSRMVQGGLSGPQFAPRCRRRSAYNRATVGPRPHQ
jgi:hypothetical protein